MDTEKTTIEDYAHEQEIRKEFGIGARLSILEKDIINIYSILDELTKKINDLYCNKVKEEHIKKNNKKLGDFTE